MQCSKETVDNINAEVDAETFSGRPASLIPRGQSSLSDLDLHPNTNVVDGTTHHETNASVSEEYVDTHLAHKVEIGCVKWFNNKVGYGFITVKHENVTFDIFVHHSAIQVHSDQYRYLVQGEYVQFKWSITNNRQYKWNAVSVSGIGNGPLMCETRNELRATESTQSSYEKERRGGTRPSRNHRSVVESNGGVNMMHVGTDSLTVRRVSKNRFPREPRSNTKCVDSDGFQMVGTKRIVEADKEEAPAQ